MAMTLMDGTAGTADVQITIPGGVSTSYKCVINSVTFRLRRGFSTQRTLCSGPWEARAPQGKQGFLTLGKFASKGAPLSDPSILFSVSTPIAITFTADTGCTITGTWHAAEDSIGLNAGDANMPGTLDFESYGALTFVWVVV